MSGASGDCIAFHQTLLELRDDWTSRPRASRPPCASRPEVCHRKPFSTERLFWPSRLNAAASCLDVSSVSVKKLSRSGVR